MLLFYKPIMLLISLDHPILVPQTVSVSVPSPDTVNIVLNESTISPIEKPEALDEWAVTPRKQRKRRAPDSAKQICDKLKESPVYEDKFLLLSNTLQECDGVSDDKMFCCQLRMSIETLIMSVEMTQN